MTEMVIRNIIGVMGAIGCMGNIYLIMWALINGER